MHLINESQSHSIVFCHLLNDFSGSPRVLNSVISTFAKRGIRSKLYIGSSGEGALSSCGIKTRQFWYRRSSSKLITLLNYLISQLVLFFLLANDRTINKNAIVYVNTLLPIGASLYGYFTRRKVIYHVHEISISPNLLREILCWVAKITASKSIFVSKVHLNSLNIEGMSKVVVYNSLSEKYSEIAEKSKYIQRRNGIFRVLMLASPRDYKGIPEFFRLAQTLKGRPDIAFDLVLNDEPVNVEMYTRSFELAPNVAIFSKTSDTSAFYERASVVLNLSRIDQWIETFGLTVLEAMAYGIPVIVPPVGGPSELVVDSIHGYKVDSRNFPVLLERLTSLADSEDLCLGMSSAARDRARQFTFKQFEKSIISEVEGLLVL